MRESLIKSLHRDRRDIHIHGRKNYCGTVHHHIGAALNHDALEDRLERDFELVRRFVESCLDFGLTLRDLALQRLLLVGELLFLLIPNLRRQISRVAVATVWLRSGAALPEL